MRLFCRIPPPLQPLDSTNSPQLRWDITVACSAPAVTPVSELTNEMGSAEAVHSAQSI